MSKPPISAEADLRSEAERAAERLGEAGRKKGAPDSEALIREIKAATARTRPPFLKLLYDDGSALAVIGADDEHLPIFVVLDPAQAHKH